MTERRRFLLAAGALVVLTSIMLFALLELPFSRLDVPYTFSGDALDKLTQVRNVVETGWLFHSDRLGYPFGYDRLDFPRFDSLNYAIMGPVAAVTGEVGLAMNLYFIAGYYLIGLAALFSFRRLGLAPGPALLCALLYAFLPYHLQRGVHHITNGAYFLVPLGMLVLAWFARGQLTDDNPGIRSKWVLAGAVAVLMPLQTPYNGVFFAFLSVVAGLIAFARMPRLRSLLPTAVLLAAVGGTFVIEQVPAIMHKHSAGPATAVANRSPFEAELLSLRLNQVMLPATSHRIPAVASGKRQFDNAMNLSAPVEFKNQYIGGLAVLGFVALLWALARASGQQQRETDDLEANVRIFALFAIATLLLAITSGLGNVIAYLITTKIRAYNRILPFFAFTCLLGSGWLLQSALARARSPIARNVLLAFVGVFALLEATSPAGSAGRAKTVAQYDREKAYFRSIEQHLGEGKAIFQLPVVWYPEHPPIHRRTQYEEFKPFLFTRTLRISSGGSQGRPGYAWGKAVESLPPADAILEVHRAGFSAILIDGYAYADEASLQATTDSFARLLAESPLISPDRRWWMFPLSGCCGTEVAQLGPGAEPPVFTYDLGGAPVHFSAGGRGRRYLAGGWAEPEVWGTWSLGPRSKLRMQIVPPPAGPLLLTLKTRALVGPDLPLRHVRITGNGETIAALAYARATATRTLHLDIREGLVGADGRLDLHIYVEPVATPQSAGVGKDPRPLGLGLVELSVTSARPSEMRADPSPTDVGQQ